MTESGLHPLRAEFDTLLRAVRDEVSEMGDLVECDIARAMWGLAERSVDLLSRSIQSKWARLIEILGD